MLNKNGLICVLNNTIYEIFKYMEALDWITYQEGLALLSNLETWPDHCSQPSILLHIHS